MTTASLIPVSIIIVNYKSAALICNCIRSIEKFLPREAYEIIVVDNDSADDSEARIRAVAPSVQYVQMSYNSGFARANNEGIRRSKYPIVLLLNPDTICVDDSILRCAQQLSQSDAAAAGVQLYDAEMRAQMSAGYFTKGGLNHVIPIPYWGEFVRRIGLLLFPSGSIATKLDAKQKVDWISGAFLMVKKQAIEKAGLLDEDFFLYAEEVEWCARLGKYGGIYIYGNLSIIHLEGGVIDSNTTVVESGYFNLYDRKGLQLMVSNHVRVRKQFGTIWFVVLLLNYTWGWLVFAVLGTLHQLIRLQSPFPVWKRVIAFGKNLISLWGLAPVILRNKPHFYKLL